MEALAALTVLIAVLATAYRLLGEGVQGIGAAEGRAGALAVAEAQLAAVGAERALEPGRFEGEGGGYAWTLEVTPRRDPPFDRAREAGLAAWRVAVTVRWEGRRSLTLATTRLAGAR